MYRRKGESCTVGKNVRGGARSSSQTKGRKAYTTYRKHTSIQGQFKTGVPRGGVLTPTLFNIYITNLPPPRRAPIHIMAYADDITITFTHTSTSAASLQLPSSSNDPDTVGLMEQTCGRNPGTISRHEY